MTTTNKYKQDVIKLTHMLERTLEEVQLYKKENKQLQENLDMCRRQLESNQQQSMKRNPSREKIRSREKVGIITKPHDSITINPEDKKIHESMLSKAEYDNTIFINKMKQSIEKTAQIIKSISFQLAKRIKQQQHGQPSLLNLQKQFNKCCQQLLRNQQQILSVSISKQMLKLELNKYKKQAMIVSEANVKINKKFDQYQGLMRAYIKQNEAKLQQNKQLKQINKQLAQELQFFKSGFRKSSTEYQCQKCQGYRDQVSFLKEQNSQFRKEIKFVLEENVQLKKDIQELLKDSEQNNYVTFNAQKNKLHFHSNKSTQRATIESNSPYKSNQSKAVSEFEKDNSLNNAKIKQQRQIWLKQNQQLVNTINMLKTQLQKHQLNLKQKQKEASKNFKLIDQLTKARDELQGALQKINLSTEQKQIKEIKSHKIIQELQLKINNLKQIIQMKKQENFGLQNQLTLKQSKIDELSQEIAQVKQQLQLKQQQLTKKQQQMLELLREKCQQQCSENQKITILKRQLALSQKNNMKHEQTIKDMIRRINENNKNYEAKLEREKMKLSQMQIMIENVRRAQKVAIGNYQSKNEQLIQLKKSLNQLTRSWGIDNNELLLEGIEQIFTKKTELQNQLKQQRQITIKMHEEQIAQGNKKLSYLNNQILAIVSLNNIFTQYEKQQFEYMDKKQNNIEQIIQSICKKYTVLNEQNKQLRELLKQSDYKMGEIQTQYLRKQQENLEKIDNLIDIKEKLEMQIFENKKQQNIKEDKIKKRFYSLQLTEKVIQHFHRPHDCELISREHKQLDIPKDKQSLQFEKIHQNIQTQPIQIPLHIQQSSQTDHNDSQTPRSSSSCDIEILNEQITEYKGYTAALLKQIEELREKLISKDNQYDSKLFKMEQELHEKSNIIEQFKTDNQVLKWQSEDISASCKQRQSLLQQTINKLTEKLHQIETSNKNNIQGYELVVQQLKQELNIAKNSQNQEKYIALLEQFEEISQKKQQYESELSDIKQQMENLRDDYEQKINCIQKQKDEISQANKQNQAKILENLSSITQNQVKIQELYLQLSKLKEELKVHLSSQQNLIQDKKIIQIELQNLIQQKKQLQNKLEELQRNKAPSVQRASKEGNPQTNKFIDLPLQMKHQPKSNNIIPDQSNLLYSQVSSFSQQNRYSQLSRHTQVSIPQHSLLQAENKNLKKELMKNKKMVNKLKEQQHKISMLQSENQLLIGEIQLKKMQIQGLQKELKGKSEQSIKLARKVENLEQELTLQKKRNKNFEQLYDKYKNNNRNKIPEEGQKMKNSRDLTDNKLKKSKIQIIEQQIDNN